MPDKAQHNSRTGEVRRVAAEPPLRPEITDPSDLSEAGLVINSSTGVMRIVAEKPHDDTAARDQDAPD